MPPLHEAIIVGFDGGVEHHLQIVIIPEKAFVTLDDATCLREVAVSNYGIGYLSGEAGRANDKPFVVLLEQRVVDSRFMVKAILKALRYKAAERAIPTAIFRQ